MMNLPKGNFPSFPLACLCVGIAAFSGCGGSDGASGDDGPAILSVTSLEPEGENCPHGGTRTSEGQDLDGNGFLSEDEVASVSFECFDAPGCEPCDAGYACDEDASSATWHQCVPQQESCVPVQQADAAVCAGANAVCGRLETTDSCGNVRVVESCGECLSQGKMCLEDNTCGCRPLTCEEQGIDCGEAYDGCGNFISCGPACAENSTTRIRLMTGNLTSENASTYDAGHGIRIFKGLKPHVAMVQEFLYGKNTETDRRRMVIQAFGERYRHFVQSKDAGNTIPNGIVSYYPIKSGGTIEDENVSGTRKHVWARIDIPGKHDLWVFSVHLSTNQGLRQSSAIALADAIQDMGIPEDDYVAIGGDFNSSDYRDKALVALKNSDVVAMDTANDCPIDQDGRAGTDAGRTKIFDGIYTSANLKKLLVQVEIGEAEGLTKRGLVFDSQVFEPLSAVAPVLKKDSGATNMQHMGVVKDYGVAR